MFKHWMGVTALVMTAGCAMMTPQPAQPVASIHQASPLSIQHAPARINPSRNTPTSAPSQVRTLPSSLPDELKKTLLAQHSEWHGTRYRMGGLSKQGIDCSGFVFLTYQELGINLPRDTSLQSRQGRDVSRQQLQIGDLVFFHTGRNNHVGIYMGENRFLHASTREGVKISRMTDTYWTRTYWKARRLDLASSAQLARLP